MALRLSFSFYGDVQLNRTLLNMADRVTDARPVWEAMARRFRDSQDRQFATEGGHASGGWAPLSARYAAWKRKRYPGTKILERTGALKASLTRRPFGVEQLTADSMRIGSHIPYGLYHQRGDGLPRRRPIELRESDRVEWVRMLQRYVRTGEF